MIKPLVIGKKQFETNVIQAPLAGISCAPFRQLVWQFGGVAYCCTEMLSAHHIASGTDRSPRYQSRAANEKNLCWQLSGNNPDVVARAATYAISQKADLLDLNCGCPQPKIRKKNCGSQLLTDEKKLAQLLLAMRQDDKTPITMKMRIDANQKEFCDLTVAKMAEQAGADAIIVHGRHWTHDYDVPAQTEAIAAIVATVNIPVIANGDIVDAASLKAVFEKTNCAGFMIARASVGQPWLFQQVTDPHFKIPSNKAVGELFLQHAEGLVELEGEKVAMLQCRKFGKYYARAVENKAVFIQKLYEISDFSALIELVGLFFG